MQIKTSTDTFHAIEITTKSGVRLFGRYPSEKSAKESGKADRPTRRVVVVEKTTTYAWGPDLSTRKKQLANFQDLDLKVKRVVIKSAKPGEKWQHSLSGNIRKIVRVREACVELVDTNNVKIQIDPGMMASVYRPVTQTPKKKRCVELLG